MSSEKGPVYLKEIYETCPVEQSQPDPTVSHSSSVELSEISQPDKQRFFVQISDGRWVKRTSQFGMFYGSIVLTNNPNDRLWFTREIDAKRRADTFNYRVSKSYESKKFKGLTAEAKSK